MIKLLNLRAAYHPFGVELIRTTESQVVIADSRRRYGGDGMRGMHNKTVVDVRKIRW